MDSIDFSQFQQYTRDVARVVDKITLTTSKQIGFPQAFAKRNNVNDFEGAILYWNEPSQAIIVRFTNDMTVKGVLKLAKSERYGAYLSVSTFLATYNIDPKKYERRYDYQKINPELLGIQTTDPMYVFQIKKINGVEAYDGDA